MAFLAVVRLFLRDKSRFSVVGYANAFKRKHGMITRMICAALMALTKGRHVLTLQARRFKRDVSQLSAVGNRRSLAFGASQFF